MRRDPSESDSVLLIELWLRQDRSEPEWTDSNPAEAELVAAKGEARSEAIAVSCCGGKERSRSWPRPLSGDKGSESGPRLKLWAPSRFWSNSLFRSRSASRFRSASIPASGCLWLRLWLWLWQGLGLGLCLGLAPGLVPGLGGGDAPNHVAVPRKCMTAASSKLSQ